MYGVVVVEVDEVIVLEGPKVAQQIGAEMDEPQDEVPFDEDYNPEIDVVEDFLDEEKEDDPKNNEEGEKSNEYSNEEEEDISLDKENLLLRSFFALIVAECNHLLLAHVDGGNIFFLK